MEEWLEKCLSCKHSYHRNDDADTIYCRCRNGRCNFVSKGTFSVDSPEWSSTITTVEDLTSEELEKLKQNIDRLRNK